MTDIAHAGVAREKFDPTRELDAPPGSAREATERKLAEERLRVSEERYRTLFSSIDEGFCLVEVLFDENAKPVDYRFVEVNPVFEQQTGLHQALGKTARQLVPDLEDFWFEVYGSVALTGKSVRFENRSEPMNRWFDVNAFRTGDPDKRTVAILFKDITARKRAEDEVRESQLRMSRALEVAENANRLKDDFLATVSHELRTPLNTVLGWASLLREGKLDEATAARAVETIQRSAQTQAELVDDLLDVSRIIRGQLRLNVGAADLTAIVSEAIENARPAASAKGIAVRSTLDPAAGLVAGDAARLQQVVWNLVSNAIKFTPRGGRVDIGLGRAESQARLTVSDTGEGIDPAFMPQVFDRFRQAAGASARPRSGLGLGLAIVRHLVELHGGTVDAESPGLGHGATFTVRIPLMAKTTTVAQESAPEAPVPSVGASPSPMSLDGVTVLVVDDEPDAREILSTVLERRGAEVIAVESARAALEALARRRPDVLVSDVGMPGEDGFALIQQVRRLDTERGGDVPAVAVTAYARGEDRARILAAGFHMHLAKPVQPSDLVAAVCALSGSDGQQGAR